MPKLKPFARKIFVQAPENYFQCAFCDKIYRHQLGLKLHDKICPFSKQHSRTFLEEASFQCFCCNINFNNQIQIREHILKKHNGDWRVATRRGK